MKNFLYTVIFLFPFISEFAASPQTFNFRHYTVDNGLSSNIVRSILQDKRGFIWIGTEEGLNFFDGQTIKQYLNNKDTPCTLGSNYINVLFEDSEDKIWIGTDIGVYLYLYEKDMFYLFRPQTEHGNSITSVINNIIEDQHKNIWIATYGQGIFKYNLVSKKLEQYMYPKEPQGLINYIYVDRQDNVWVASRSPQYPLGKYNPKKNAFECFSFEMSKERESNIFSIQETSKNELYLGTWNNGLLKLNRKTKRIETYLSPKESGGILHIHSITELKPNVLMIGSDDGLSILNTQTKEHQLLVSDETNSATISNKFVYPIVKDTEGGIWVGTYYGGVNYVSPNNGMFKGYTHSHFRNSINGNIVSRFCEDKEGNIWIATDDGGLNHFYPETGRFEAYMPQTGRNSISYHNVHALCLDEDKLWIGTYSGGLDVLDLKTGHFKHYDTNENNPQTLDGNSIYSIFKDKDKNIWVASMSGINLYRRKTDNFSRIKKLGFMTIDIKQDKDGNIWFATQGKGLVRYNPIHKKWSNYTYNEGNIYSIASNLINCMYVDSESKLYVGTSNGLCMYNPSKDNFSRISLHIPSNNICGIVESQKVLWLTTSKGLVRYDPAITGNSNCQIFTKSDGLQSEQFTFNSVLESSSGEIYIGTFNGFNSFCPNKIKKNAYAPPTFITHLEIFNKEVNIDSNGKLPCALSLLDHLDLSYKDNVFSLRYAALSYSTPEKNKYAYKLEGFDNAWNYVGGQTKATYTNLPAGKYTFRVKACNNDGIWNKTGAKLTIIIHPPFYLTTGFKILYGALIILLIYSIVRMLLHRSERIHKEKIKELQQKQEKEIYNSKIKFFTMIAHEIRTPVSLIIGPMENIMSTAASLPETVKKELGIINRNSIRLLTLVNQLLDFRKVEEGAFVLSPNKYRICELLENVYERFKPMIEQRGIEFIFNRPEEDFEAIIDQEAITKVISNLLTNANKFTKDKISLSCKADQQSNSFKITVSDNGCGIPKDKQERIFHPFYQIAGSGKPGTGIGLNLVKSLVEAHHGFIEVESEIGKGSKFTIMLPMNATIQQAKPATISPLPPLIEMEPSLGEEHARSYDSGKICILIIDDNKDIRTFLADNFLDEYQIITANDGVEGLDELSRNSIHLIICDLMMPRMDGIAFCKEVRNNKMYSHIPIILLTAKTDINSKVEGMNTGADVYMEKPFSIQYLRACVRSLLSSREMLKKKFSELPFAPLKSVAINKTEEDFLTQMNSIIEKNIANQEFSVDTLAKDLCISRSGLFAKVKTMTDITPNELIQLIRLKTAARLLTENKFRINEVAYAVGFNNPSYFSKCFQKQFGVKPGDFALKSKQIKNA
ncbi:MAG: ATP-binding protein [Bacteroides sp.]|jgi:signal transduction histidine kinase/ligand-binding sensor domain-containing protein/DNA-binding response OmpR family regulator|nr:ATP-binding protein [Bacteroides sp.]